MGNNSKIEWREASEDEYNYIKEKYARPMVALTVGMVFMFLLIIATVGFLIYCNIKNHSVGAIISSVIIYPIMLILMVAIIYVISKDIRRLNSLYRRKILVSDATVQNVNVQMGTRGRTRAKVQFITSTGVHVSMNSLGLEPLAEKGKHALILNFGKQDRKDWQFVVREDLTNINNIKDM